MNPSPPLIRKLAMLWRIAPLHGMLCRFSLKAGRGTILLVMAGALLAGCEVETEGEQEAETPVVAEDATDGRRRVTRRDGGPNSDSSTDSTSDTNSGEWEAVEEAVDELAGAVRAIRGLEDPVAAVDAEELERLLPNRVGDMARIEVDSRGQVLGLGLSGVSATYGTEETQVSVTIMDTAQFRGMASRVITFWIGQVVDKESHSGYERTRTYRQRNREYQSYEKYESELGEQVCAIMVWVADRFMVVVAGTGVHMDSCEAGREMVSYRKLERLAERFTD